MPADGERASERALPPTPTPTAATPSSPSPPPPMPSSASEERRSPHSLLLMVGEEEREGERDSFARRLFLRRAPLFSLRGGQEK